jgi:hypothetical protein
MKAWELIARDGWCQESFGNSLGQRCALGAIFCVYLDTEPIERARRRLMRAADTDNVACWNDAIGRTQSEVIRVMKDADV